MTLSSQKQSWLNALNCEITIISRQKKYNDEILHEYKQTFRTKSKSSKSKLKSNHRPIATKKRFQFTEGNIFEEFNQPRFFISTLIISSRIMKRLRLISLTLFMHEKKQNERRSYSGPVWRPLTFFCRPWAVIWCLKRLGLWRNDWPQMLHMKLVVVTGIAFQLAALEERWPSSSTSESSCSTSVPPSWFQVCDDDDALYAKKTVNRKVWMGCLNSNRSNDYKGFRVELEVTREFLTSERKKISH